MEHCLREYIILIYSSYVAAIVLFFNGKTNLVNHNNKVVQIAILMRKLQYYFCLLFRIRLSEKQKKYWNDMGEITHHLNSGYEGYEWKILEKYGERLPWKRRWKKIPSGSFLICLYLNPITPEGLRAGIMHDLDQYNKFVKSVNIRLFWYILSNEDIKKYSRL